MEEKFQSIILMVRDAIAHDPYFAIGVFGIFLLIAAIGDWDWIFEPPYTTKNIIGNFYGRTVYRLHIGFMGVFFFVTAILMTMSMNQ